MPGAVKLEAVLFDLYGTLIDIHTDEGQGRLWERLARYLRYQGLPADAQALRREFFAAVRQGKDASRESHPEIDVVAIFADMLGRLGYAGHDQDIVQVVQLFRTLSMRRFGLFPDTLRCLRALGGQVKLGLVSDAQRAFLEPEIAMTGLAPLFDTLVVSSDYGYRKPDPRLFHKALGRLGVAPGRAVYVGDNPLRDVGGARAAGLGAVLLRRSGAGPAESGPPADWTIGGLDELLVSLRLP
jgi:putative hydrolase of the HAD superfamily